MRYIWMMVTSDKYELPLAVADTAAELGKMVGATKNSIMVNVSKVKHGHHKKSRYVRVEIDEEDEE